ncbi:AAA family ATPase [Erwinia sp. E_sp_W01_6]|uniref:AAA family ATPase n=1 Tax=Erwinia sp. E_sp_W01_6 TaxID=3039408 RepID=UPI0030D0BB95
MFIPGLQDTQQTGLSSDRLFTEHPQAVDVLAAFEETKRTGSPALVVITGAPGTGKSSLIASSLKLLQQEKLLVTMVKADRHAPVLPYAVLITAFRSLVLTLLGLPASDVARWRAHFGRLLGDYAGLAAHFIPEMAALMEQKARIPPDVHSPDARKQFHNMACNMARAFVMPGRPLVIFIDDIHWADQAGLELLQHLLSQGEEIPVMLVVAHRDVASLPDALTGTQLEKLHQSASRTVMITPVSLSVKNIACWLSGIFHVKGPPRWTWLSLSMKRPAVIRCSLRSFSGRRFRTG